MNFKKLSKEKKNQLVLVALVTLVLMVGLGYGLIQFQLGYVKTLEHQKVEAEKNFKRMMTIIESADAIEAQKNAAIKELADHENAMVTGDKFAWMVTTIKSLLRQHSKLDVPDYSTILEDECSLLAKFPYSQVSISIKGTGHYHDIGRFIAEMENDRPHFRVLNLEIEPAAAQGERDKAEKLTFKMSIAALVKPG